MISGMLALYLLSKCCTADNCKAAQCHSYIESTVIVDEIGVAADCADTTDHS